MSTDALATIEQLIGRFNGTPRDAVMRAITDDPAGCVALANRIKQRRNVINAAGIFISCIAAGEHRTTPATGKPAEQAKRLDPIERAKALYRGKLDDLNRHCPQWTLLQRHEFAMDYALDHCGKPGIRPSDVIEGVQLGVDDEDDIPW